MTVPYKFPAKKRPKRLPEIGDFEFSKLPGTEEEIGIIQGHVAASPEEWRVAMALGILKRDFIYQYTIGIPGIVGSYKIDFVVEDVPKWFPLEVQSVRWHTGRFAIGEDIRAAKVERYFDTQIRYVFEDELQSQGEAVAAIKEVLYSPASRRRLRV